MIPDFALEIVTAPSGSVINLPNVAPTGRLTWASRLTTAQQVLYVLDSTTAQEWGVGAYDPVAHTITRPTVVGGNSAGTQAQLSAAAFGGNCRCYGGVPSAVMIGQIWGGNTGRNLLTNGTFGYTQRGPATVPGPLPSDRWACFATGSTGRSVSVQNISDADRAAIMAAGPIGNSDITVYMQYLVSGTANAGDYEILGQRCESVRRIGGRTVTVSFWAKAPSAGLKIGLNIQKSYGTGAVSLPDRALTTGASVTLTTSWVRYAVPIVVPSNAGKSFGAGNTDWFALELFLSSGSTANTVAGGIGVQAWTGTGLQIWGAQLEIGLAPSPFDRMEFAIEAQQCQRFYQIGAGANYGWGNAGVLVAVMHPLIVPMRVGPVISSVFGTATNISSPSLTYYSGGPHLIFQGTPPATGGYGVNYTYNATADLV